MFRTFSIMMLSLLVFAGSQAEAALRASLTQQGPDIEAAETYAISGRSSRTSATAIFDEVGKRIRQSYYRNSYEVDGYSPVTSTPEAAVQELLVTKGEWSGLNAQDEATLRAWIRDHRVQEAQIVGLSTNYMSGTGVEDLYYFLSETEDVVLVIRAFWYAE